MIDRESQIVYVGSITTLEFLLENNLIKEEYVNKVENLIYDYRRKITIPDVLESLNRSREKE